MKNTALILLLVSTFAGTDAFASIERDTGLQATQAEDVTLFVRTVDKISRAPLHAGEGRTFTVPFKTTIKYAREATTESGLIIESSSKIDENTYMILAKARTSAWSWGELVRVVVIDTPGKEVSVRVFSQRRVSVNIGAKKHYANSILSAIEAKIDFE